MVVDHTCPLVIDSSDDEREPARAAASVAQAEAPIAATAAGVQASTLLAEVVETSTASPGTASTAAAELRKGKTGARGPRPQQDLLFR